MVNCKASYFDASLPFVVGSFQFKISVLATVKNREPSNIYLTYSYAIEELGEAFGNVENET